MSISFAGLDQMVVTFRGEDVTPGYPVVVMENGAVENAAMGDAPVGFAVSSREGYAGVLLRGYAEVPYSGDAPELGWTEMVADGEGGLRAGTDGEGGHRCLVVTVDAEKKQVGLFL